MNRVINKAGMPVRFVIFIAGLTAIIAGGAYAAGYNSPTAGNSPHGGYSSTSNQCKTCHAVHEATGSFRLLRDNGASTECNFCHGASGVANAKPIALDENGHGLPTGASGTIYAPNDLTETARFSVDASVWGCANCHAAHGSNTIQLTDVGGGTNTKLLKKYPNPNKTSAAAYTNYDPASSTQKLSNWCSGCHNANIGLHTNAKVYNGSTNYFGHDSSSDGGTNAGATYGNPATWQINPGDSNNNGPSCKQCHIGDGDATTAYDFPHSSGSTNKLLKSGASSSQLDGVCLSCHTTANMP